MRWASPPDRVGAERSNWRYPSPTRSRNCNRARISASRSRPICVSRGVSFSLENKSRVRSTEPLASEATDRSRKRTLRAIGLSRCPSHALQGVGSCSYHSFHQISSPLCSASKPVISTPVPKQLSHHPCLELNENKRGSSSAKLLPQEGQARFVENTTTLSDFGPSTCTRPFPKSNARDNAWCSWVSCFASTSTCATGSSIVCSLKRDRRGHFEVEMFAPSTRRTLKPFLAAHLARSV